MEKTRLLLNQPVNLPKDWHLQRFCHSIVDTVRRMTLNDDTLAVTSPRAHLRKALLKKLAL